MTIRHSALLIACSASALTLGACKKVPNNATGEAAVEEARAAESTIANAIDGVDKLSMAQSLIAAADLDDITRGTGPYTLLLPSDTAFDALPADILETLQSENAKPVLTGLLTGHIIPGTVTASDIKSAIAANGESATMKTMAGDVLTFTRDGDGLAVAAAGGEAVAIADEAYQANNGITHVIAGVLVRE